jgi:hypothetical protein
MEYEGELEIKMDNQSPPDTCIECGLRPSQSRVQMPIIADTAGSAVQ